MKSLHVLLLWHGCSSGWTRWCHMLHDQPPLAPCEGAACMSTMVFTDLAASPNNLAAVALAWQQNPTSRL